VDPRARPAPRRTRARGARGDAIASSTRPGDTRWSVRRLAATGLAAVLFAAGLSSGSQAHASGDVDAGRQKAEPCAACHGRDGNATIPGTPSLAGMPAFYTHWQLIMFRDGRRKDAQMAPFVERLGDKDLADLSAYYAAQRITARPAPTEPARVDAGRALATAQHCLQCHGPGLMGQQAGPPLAGQDAAYLRRRLLGYKNKTGSDLDGMMTMIAQSLSEADIENLVHFILSVEPAK
jgi:cytochrome c553